MGAGRCGGGAVNGGAEGSVRLGGVAFAVGLLFPSRGSVFHRGKNVRGRYDKFRRLFEALDHGGANKYPLYAWRLRVEVAVRVDLRATYRVLTLEGSASVKEHVLAGLIRRREVIYTSRGSDIGRKIFAGGVVRIFLCRMINSKKQRLVVFRREGPRKADLAAGHGVEVRFLCLRYMKDKEGNAQYNRGSRVATSNRDPGTLHDEASSPRGPPRSVKRLERVILLSNARNLNQYHVADRCGRATSRLGRFRSHLAYRFVRRFVKAEPM